MEPRQQEGEDKDGEDADKQAEVKGGGGGRPQPRNSVVHINCFKKVKPRRVIAVDKM